MASAYTTFSNQGTWMKQFSIREVADENGKVIWRYKPVEREILDRRIAYMITNLMEEVLRSGTAAAARSRGFTLPAAGKTGTSHDAWFVGFTTKLLCAVWVGFDDNTEMPLDGAKAAMPIWVEFMKRAHRYREYKNVGEFDVPDGIVTVQIDPLSGKLATTGCPQVRSEVFIAGTQPVDYCPLHGGAGRTLITGWDTPESGGVNREEPGAGGSSGGKLAKPRPAQQAETQQKDKPQEPSKPHGFWDRIKSIFK
jgi:penicillin-binding protein 1B